MRKPITYLNLALLALAMWLGAGTRATWRRNHARYGQFAAAPAAGMLAGDSTAGIAVGMPGTSPADYSDLITHNLFSPDRNNEQPLASVSKTRPPLPLVIGTLNVGSGPVALMAEPDQAAQGTFRQLKVGQEISGYRLAKIAEHEVVLEFEGQKTTIGVYESAENVRRAAGQVAARPPTPAGPAASQVLTAVPSASSSGPAPSAAPGAAAASAAAEGTSIPTGSPYLTVTIEGNRKKYSRKTPFGVQVWYEELPPAPKSQ